MITIDELDWTEHTEFPAELNEAGNGFSVDVLVYSSKTGEHTVGWFDFNKMSWRFLCRQAHGEFMWRHFNDKIDKP